MKIIDHKLDDAAFVPTPNMGGVITPRLLVIHYTVIKTMAATVRAFQASAAQASAHLVLDVDGALTQMVPFNRKAWHAGESEWAGNAGCNNFSIGIEVVNPGPLEQRGQDYRDVNQVPWTGAVVEAKHKNGRARWGYWAAYTPKQMEKLYEVGALLMEAYKLEDVAGHDDIAPTRKIDPGPAFPMESYRSALLGRSSDEPERYEATTVLNIRKGAGVNFDPAPGSPLTTGTRVRVADHEGMWWHVLTEEASPREGWVHSRYLTPARPSTGGTP